MWLTGASGRRPSTSHSAQGHHSAVALCLGALGHQSRHHARVEHLPVAADDVVAHQPDVRAAACREVARQNVARRIESHGSGDRVVFEEQVVEHPAVVILVVEPQRGVMELSPESFFPEVAAESPPRGCGPDSNLRRRGG